jgi:2-phospho-L-lactate guanylyltransferase
VTDAGDRPSARARIERSAIQKFESKPKDTGIRRTGAPERAVHEAAPTTEWFVVVPVRGTDASKSRLGLEPARAIAMAMAHDTVAAVLATPGVAGVLVVTSEAAASDFDDLDAFILAEENPNGLDAAIAAGLDTAADFGEPGRGIAVMLGDLPALAPDELAAALEAARALPRAMVADASGAGTTLITARDGETHAPAFGSDSARRHREAGYVEIAVPVDSGLRIDVDTADDVLTLLGRLGPRSARILAP